MTIKWTARIVDLASDARRRRMAYAGAAVVLALLCVVPQPYVGRAKILPQDPNSGTISSMLSALGGRLGGLGSLLGEKQPIDLYLILGRSDGVQDDVIRQLRLAGPSGRYASPEKAKVALDRKVDVHSLTGGVLEIETRTHDADESRALTDAYVTAISRRIAAMGREQIDQRQKVIQQRFGEANDRLAVAESRMNAFRRSNNLADPQAQLGAALALRTGLEAQLQARQVQLGTLERFAGPDNAQLKAVQSEVAGLRAQIASTAQARTSATGPNVAGLSEVSTRYLNLYRDYRFAQALFEVYARYTEEIAVQSLVATTAASVQLIEAPHLDAERHYNVPAVALLALLLLGAAFTEIYAPATGIILFPAKRED
jgi:hypothetical protein